jgi:hypothetical protein
MKITWSIDAKDRLVRLRYSGLPDYEFWEKAMIEIFSHPDYRPGFGFVADLRNSGVPDQAHLRRVAAIFGIHREEVGESRWANVTTDPAHYGMSRMAQVFVEGQPVPLRIFEALEAAERWAGGGPDPESP